MLLLIGADIQVHVQLDSSAPAGGPRLLKTRRARASALLAVALLACAGCAGALEDEARFLSDGGADAGASDAGLADAGEPDGGPLDAGGARDAGPSDGGCNALATILSPTCATAQCHSSGTQQAGLDLQSAGLPARLVNQRATGGPGLIINPQSPDSSVLYTKTLSTPPFGAQMPLLGTPLDTDQLACLRSWIEQAVADP